MARPAADAYPVQAFHRPGGGGGGGGGGRGGQWHNLGAAYTAVKLLRPQGSSLVLYAKPDGRLVFAYPILAGDRFERPDGATVSWSEPESGAEFALRFGDEAACAAVCGAVFSVTRRSPTAVDGIADRLAQLQMTPTECATAVGDIGGRLAQFSIGQS